MSFDAKAFMKAKAEPRTGVVAVTALAAFFAEGEAPEFTVRGLSGAELARVHESVTKNATLESLAKALATRSADPEKLKELLGLSTTKQPDEIVRRLHLLTAGAVVPEVSQAMAIKIAEVAPAEFYLLTNKITELTGEGYELGKPKPSGGARTSATA